MFEIGDKVKYNGMSGKYQRKDLTIGKIYIVKDKGKRFNDDVQYMVINDKGEVLYFDEGSPVGKGFEKVEKEMDFLELLKGY